MDTIITVYFVGYSPTDALKGLPFDSAESAEDYRQDTNPSLHIYRAPAMVLLSRVVLDSEGDPPEPDYEWLDELREDALRYQDERTDL